MNTFVRTLVGAALAAALVVPAACANEVQSTPKQSDTGSPSSSSTAASAQQSNRWLDLLRVLPVTENTTRAVFLQDNVLLRDSFHSYDWQTYAVSYTEPMFWREDARTGEAEFQRDLGFDSADVNKVVCAGFLPDNYYQALEGRFSSDNIDSAVKTGALNDILKVADHDGHKFYSWGADWEARMEWRSQTRRFAYGSRLAVVDDFVFWVPWTDGIEQMMDGYDGKIPSLADQKDYEMLAEGLAELDTVNAFFSTESQSVADVTHMYDQQFSMDNSGQASFTRELDRPLRLERYQGLATGAGADGEGYYLALVLLNPDEATARRNASLLKQRIDQAQLVWRGLPWSQYVETSEIRTEGRLTLAKLYGPACELWQHLSPSVKNQAPYEPLLVYK